MADINCDCVFCREQFVPPQKVPYLMSCSHSICNRCLQKNYDDKLSYVICPRDLERSKITEIKANIPARRAIERLQKEHKNFNQNNQLFCIQSLSKCFESSLGAKKKGKEQFIQLIDKIIKNQVERLNTIHRQIIQQIQGPFHRVKQWKSMVKQYLSSLKSANRSTDSNSISDELGYYIQQGRRIKDDLSQYNSLDFSQIANMIANNPIVCLRKQFTLESFYQATKNQFPNNNQSKKSFDKENTFKKLDSFSQFEKTKSIKAQFETSDYRIESSISIGDCQKLSELLTVRQVNQKRKTNTLKQLSNNDQDGRLFVYTPSEVTEQKPEMYSEQILLTEKEDKKAISRLSKINQSQWKPQKINFLQQWEVSKYLPIENIEVEKRQPFDMQKQKNAYIRKMQMLKVQDAMSQTIFHNGSWQLINFSVAELDLYLYLTHCDWQNIQVIKFVKTNLSDRQLNELLNFIYHSKVNTLVLSGNNLTQSSLDAFLNYTRMASNLKNIYISKNNINTLKGHTRQKISLLRQNGMNLYI